MCSRLIQHSLVSPSLAIRQSHLLIPCILLKSTNINATHNQTPPHGGFSIKIKPVAGKKAAFQGGQLTVFGPLTQSVFTSALAVPPTPSIAAQPTSLVSVSVFLVWKLPACGLKVLPILTFVLSPHLPTHPTGKDVLHGSWLKANKPEGNAFPPTVLAWSPLFIGAYLLAMLFLAFLFFQWTFGACSALSLGSFMGSV